VRIELPQSQPQPVQAPASASAAAPSTAEVRLTSPPRRRSPHERWVKALTAWRVAVPMLAACTALLGWALIFREAQGRKALIVMARSTPAAKGTNAVVTAESLAVLKEQQLSRSRPLIRERKEILPLLSQLEIRARELGWHCERALKPAVAAPFGLTNLTLHAATLHLTAEDHAGTPPFHRFADWLRSISSLPCRSEITQLDLKADANGLGSAVLTLQFYSANHHAEASTK
jgi:hypothetical protein